MRDHIFHNIYRTFTAERAETKFITKTRRNDSGHEDESIGQFISIRKKFIKMLFAKKIDLTICKEDNFITPFVPNFHSFKLIHALHWSMTEYKNVPGYSTSY